MTIDMKFYNVYYFCHLANESMGKFEYATNHGLFLERQFEIEPDEFPKVSVLREYCLWLVESVIFEQANLISNGDKEYDFTPIWWLRQAIFKYQKIDISDDEYLTFMKSNNLEGQDDYLDVLNTFIEYIDKTYNDLYLLVVDNIATEVEYILFQNRDFLLRFNEQVAVAFEDNLRKRSYTPEWVKRAVLFRDKGCCVFCKKDLTGLYTLLEDNEKHFDHMVALENGGINDVCNIQLSCKACNLGKSANNKTSTLYQSAY